MSVKIRPYRKGGWEVDIRVELPDRTEVRERKRAPTPSRSGALRWARARERELLLHGPKKPRKEVPTLTEFYPRFLEGHAAANRQKPSSIAAKESICRVHLVPLLGEKRLDAVQNEDIQRLKVKLQGRSAKTVNNVLTTLNTLLRIAVEWQVIDEMPCRIQLLRVAPTQAAFYDFEEYGKLIEAARTATTAAHTVVLLGGDAGLRCGEMIGLEWSDIDFGRRQLTIQRSEWKGNVTAPKGGRPRVIPLTTQLSVALRAHQHLRGPRVLCREDGSSVTQRTIRNLMKRVVRAAGTGAEGVHILRHTFCSHLATRGAPARAIQELAGHRNLSTTQRYMHLSPAAVEGAIRLLEQPSPVSRFGDILETGEGSKQKISR